ncbi:MAG: hypothetical protein JO263_06200 [Candidatus Eremiobacteraeota bacterium]|nr:hypothetical protein [Candidatus Eremiobacteraeota bacterium]
MKRSTFVDKSTGELVGVPWLVDAIAPASPYGERHFSELQTFFVGEERTAQARAQRIERIAAALDSGRLSAVQILLREVADVNAAVARAAMGDVLADPAFLELRRFSATLGEIDGLIEGAGEFERFSNPGICALRDALAAGQRDATSFYLADAFDTRLTEARQRRARGQAEFEALRGREEQRVAAALGREDLSDEFIVMRADLRGELPAGVHVIREAPTYFLCRIQYDEATITALQRRDAADRAVAEAEEQVRARLSSLVREHVAALTHASVALGEFDVLVAAAVYAQRHRCTAATIIEGPALEFAQARFLPLEEELSEAGRAFTPLDVRLAGAAVLTGPNMGGKSVCLQTCGFVLVCAAYGLPVPAARARVGLFDQIAWLGLGRDERIGGLLSSFAREVLSLKAVIERDAPRLLLLADEFARTTTPHEGRALSIALVERLRARGACAMLATHLGGVAAAAGVPHFAVRGLRGIPSRPRGDRIDEVLAELGALMDYRVAEVGDADAPAGDAVALADLLGLDPEFIAAAYRALAQ